MKKSMAVGVLVGLTGPLIFVFQNFSVPEMNAQTNSGEEAIDFVTMNVCVDHLDRPIAGDPGTCYPQRNIRIGESVPYIRTDFGPNGARYQAVTSYPMPGRDGTLKLLVAKHMRASFTRGYQFSYDQHHDGFDLIEVNGPNISIARTSDPGCFDQMMSDDGWILFDRGNHRGQSFHLSAITRLHPRPGCDAHSSSDAYTVWERFHLTYTSGRTFDSILTHHFASRQLDQTNNALEKFYLTKQYGFTRWEAWIPHARCLADHGAHSPICTPEFTNRRCNGATGVEIGGNWWVRVDCRDATNYMAVDRPYLPFTEHMAASSVDFPAAINAARLGDYVRSHYLKLLNREADPAGFLAYQNALITGAMTAQGFHQTLSRSAEARARISDLYRQVLGREADGPSLNAFQEAMASGGYFVSVRNTLAYSAESAENIRALYRRVFNREPNASEVRAHQTNLAAGAKTWTNLRYDFAYSTEATNKLTQVFRSVLERDPAPAGLENLKRSLANQNNSLAEIRRNLAAGGEANLRVYQLALQSLGRTAQTVNLEMAKNSWQGMLVEGKSLSDIRKIFARSQEAKNFIANFYQTILKRAPTSAETEHWTKMNESKRLTLWNSRQIVNTSREAMLARKIANRAWVYTLREDTQPDYLFSVSAVEGQAAGYRYGGTAFQVYREAAADLAPVHRCLVTKTGKHFLSRAANCEGHQVEGVLGYLAKAPTNVAKRPVYRCGGVRNLYTPDEARCTKEGLTRVSVIGYTL